MKTVSHYDGKNDILRFVTMVHALWMNRGWVFEGISMQSKDFLLPSQMIC